MSSTNDLRSDLLRAAGLVTAIGLDLACLLLLGIFGGHVVDAHFGSSPWGLVGGALLGVAAGALTAYQMVTRVLRR